MADTCKYPSLGWETYLLNPSVYYHVHVERVVYLQRTFINFILISQDTNLLGLSIFITSS